MLGVSSLIKKHINVLSLTTVLAVGVSFPASAETLSDALQAALNKHPGVKAAMANRDAYKMERNEYFADFFPTFKTTATGGRQYGDNSTSRGLSVTRGQAYSYLWQGSVSLTQPLFDGFETINRVSAADARRVSANFNIIDVRERLALRTVISYLDVMRAQKALHEIRSHRVRLSDYIGRIQRMVDEGAADQSLIVQALDTRAQLDSTLTEMKAQMAATEADYVAIVGHAPEPPMERPTPRLDLMPNDVESAIRISLATHPILQAGLFEERALIHDARAEVAALMPEFDGELSYLEKDQKDLIGGEVKDAKAVVRMNWDFNVAGKEWSRTKKAKMRHLESQERRKEQMRQIEREVRVAYSDLQKARENLAILQDRVKYTTDLFTSYESQFQGARVDLLQLLQADNGRFNAQLAELNAQYGLLASHFATLASMGRLTKSLNVVPADAERPETVVAEPAAEMPMPSDAPAPAMEQEDVKVEPAEQGEQSDGQSEDE